jgi:hypothetical protein
MNDVDKWKHLFINGEFANRNKILSGLLLEDVIKRPNNIKNSIYDELWHMVRWQNDIVLNENNDAEYEKWQLETNRFPLTDPKSQEELDELVNLFLNGLDKILNWCDSPKILNTKLENNIFIKDTMYSLAVHNAYHLGKIVALRQILGIWSSNKQ